MRLFALSDIHVDYEANARWVAGLSTADYRDDLLILAGDVTDRLPLLEWCLGAFVQRFRKVLFVPGNHDIWVARDGNPWDSLRKFEAVRAAVEAGGASMAAHREPGLAILPLLGWYDDSFGAPGSELREAWADYRACRWPEGFDAPRIAAHFDAQNAVHDDAGGDADAGATIVSFSHFMPRIDLMPAMVSERTRLLYPILGSTRLETRLRRLGSHIHVYGHSHLNRDLLIDGVRYVNNAYGYPAETRIAAKRLACLLER